MSLATLAETLRAQAAALTALAETLEAEKQGPAFVAPAEFLDCAGAGALLGLDARVVARRAKAGSLPGHKMPGGREWRFRRSELLEWMPKGGR